MHTRLVFVININKVVITPLYIYIYIIRYSLLENRRDNLSNAAIYEGGEGNLLYHYCARAVRKQIRDAIIIVRTQETLIVK